MRLYDLDSADDYLLDGRYAIKGMKWHDAKKEKPIQNKEVLLLLQDGNVHSGFWLKNASKYEMNVRRWKVYYGNRWYDEDEVIGWKLLQ